MAQTIAEKLAEKYDVTPSTTIAGTLKKITKDETGDVNIASLISKMEAGGSSSRVLLYENDELDFTKAGSWLYVSPSDKSLDATFKVDSGNFTLQVDDEEYTSELASGQNSYYMGVMSPGDTEHIGINKMGCAFNVTSGSPVFITELGMVMLSPTDFTEGTHSVKIYKEV